MSQNFYKQVAISQPIVSGWILYTFFDYLTDKDTMFKGLGLYIFFLGSCMWISGISILVMILRFTWFRKSYKEVLCPNFIYVLAGVFNSYLTVIWIVILVLGLIDLYFFSIGSLLVSLFSAVIILKDFYIVKAEKDIR